MAYYQVGRVKLTNLQQKVIQEKKSRITKKNIQDEKLPHELFLTTRKKD